MIPELPSNRVRQYRVIEIESNLDLTQFISPIYTRDSVLEICGEIQDDNPGIHVSIQSRIGNGPWENC